MRELGYNDGQNITYEFRSAEGNPERLPELAADLVRLKPDVLFDTGTGNRPHDANGVGWYFNPSHSWGFAPQGAAIDRDSCDVEDGSAADQRLCWNTVSGGLDPGYRCGADKDLNTSTTFERLVFHAD